MVLNAFFLVAVATVVGAFVYFVSARLSRFPRSAMDVATFLRGGHVKRMVILINPEFDAGLQAGLSPRGFKEQQRRNLHYILEFLRCWLHDSHIFLEWSCRVIRRETVDRPGEPDAHLFVEAAHKLEDAAIASRVYAIMAMLKIVCWLVLRTQWWLPLRPPQIAELANVWGKNFFETYHAFLQAVSDLAELHGPEFKEAYLQALLRPDPLDVSDAVNIS